MKFFLARVGTLVLAASMGSHAAASADAGDVASAFVVALQRHHFHDAAAMFAPDASRDTNATERALKRINDSVGGFATIKPLAYLPSGRTIKLEVRAHERVIGSVQNFIQFVYAATASDGMAVFYEVDLTADTNLPHVLSFNVELPASDASSTKRANRLVAAINAAAASGRGQQSQDAVHGTPACLSEQYVLSADKKSCVKRCPASEHYSPESKTCGGCGDGSMVDEEGGCHPGI